MNRNINILLKLILVILLIYFLATVYKYKKIKILLPEVEISGPDYLEIVSANRCSRIVYHHDVFRRYSRFSVISTNLEADYIVHAPFTVAAWKRLNFGTILLITSTQEKWNEKESRKYVLETLKNISSIVIVFVKVERVNSVMISQTGRLFVPELVTSELHLSKTIEFVTSDVDIWPIKDELLKKDKNMTIILTNSHCCGYIGDSKILMQPISWILMSGSTWKSINNKSRVDTGRCFVDDILTIYSQRFGNKSAFSKVNKGMNEAWFMDQTMISENIDRFNGGVIVRRDRVISEDRIDINKWNIPSSFLPKRYQDAHVPLIYLKNWKVGTLLKHMYGEKQMNLWSSYYKHYVMLTNK